MEAFAGISDPKMTGTLLFLLFPRKSRVSSISGMETEEISYVIRCVATIAVLLGVAGLVFTYNTLLETPQFVSLLRVIGLH